MPRVVLNASPSIPVEATSSGRSTKLTTKNNFSTARNLLNNSSKSLRHIVMGGEHCSFQIEVAMLGFCDIVPSTVVTVF
jgi:hypothetical protein